MRKVGWVLSVIDLETRDQAFRLFMETREKVNNRITDIKKKYDNLIQDRFKVIVHTPYWEVEPSKLIKVKVNRLEKTPTEILTELYVLEPLLITEDQENIIIELLESHMNFLPELLKQIPFEVVK